MRNIYLLLAIIGFIAPTILVIAESIETGNILLYTNPLATIEGMFANRISTIFMIDLLFAVLVFFYMALFRWKKTIANNVYSQLLFLCVLGKSRGFSFGWFSFVKLVLANATNHTRTRWQQ